VEKSVENIYQLLQKLTGLHRQLLESMRIERDSLVQADLKAIQTVTSAKQALIEEIHQTEQLRLTHINELAHLWKKKRQDLTLSKVIIEVQGKDPAKAEQLRSVSNALTILIQRIKAQNSENEAFISKSLEHINQMKTNILGEVIPKSNTYTPSAQKAKAPQTTRLISREV
jgi:flagellar biosynthesis/type III secretory pathway chaperone